MRESGMNIRFPEKALKSRHPSLRCDDIRQVVVIGLFEKV
jgi:hypothetical protein